MGKFAELQRQCNELQDNSDELQRQIRQKDTEIRTATRAREDVDRISQQEAEARRNLAARLQEVNQQHSQRMADLRESFDHLSEVMQADILHQGAADEEAESPQRLNSTDEAALLVPEPPQDALQVEADGGANWRELHDREEERCRRARASHKNAHSELCELEAAAASEHESAAEVREELRERQQAKDRASEVVLAELRQTELETEAVQKKKDELEFGVKALQRQLSQAMYDVGNKDREVQLKATEMDEVQRSIRSIQDEMGEVNHQLQVQCGRVQRVESSLRGSQDISPKVQSMRELVKESHAALGQLSALLEQERAQRGVYAQGLRQQRMRSELLLQLLRHFKSRTHDLAPAATARALAAAFPDDFPATPELLSAVPPCAEDEHLLGGVA